MGGGRITIVRYYMTVKAIDGPDAPARTMITREITIQELEEIREYFRKVY